MEDAVVIDSPHSMVYTFTAFAFAVAMLWESLDPRREQESGLFWRWVNNFSLGAISWYISAVAGTWFLLWVSQWAVLRQAGLLQNLGAGPLIGFFALLTVSQFMSYWVHVAFHRISWLWPIHVVHHSDVNVDVSTSYRHHPLEPLVSMPIAVPIIILLGIPPAAIAAYRLFEVSATIFSHSNIRIPEAIEKYLRYILLTPDFHRLHHCAEVQYTNSNYGSLVPWFDYIFGSASTRPYTDQKDMQLGLEYLRQPTDSRLDKLLVTPLRVKRAMGGEGMGKLSPEGGSNKAM